MDSVYPVYCGLAVETKDAIWGGGSGGPREDFFLMGVGICQWEGAILGFHTGVPL